MKPLNCSRLGVVLACASALLSSTAWAVQGERGRSPREPGPQQERSDIPRSATEQTSATLPPPSPPQSQGAERAAAHSSVVQRDLWNRLDTNGDGRISVAEGTTDPQFHAGFTALDADRDGYLTGNEYRTGARDHMQEGVPIGGGNAAPPSTAAARDALSRLDIDADGAVSARESQADATLRSNFGVIDANSDGLISDGEYRAWVKAEHK